jgi:hypothetical protein
MYESSQNIHNENKSFYYLFGAKNKSLKVIVKFFFFTFCSINHHHRLLSPHSPKTKPQNDYVVMKKYKFCIGDKLQITLFMTVNNIQAGREKEKKERATMKDLMM